MLQMLTFLLYLKGSLLICLDSVCDPSLESLIHYTKNMCTLINLRAKRFSNGERVLCPREGSLHLINAIVRARITVGNGNSASCYAMNHQHIVYHDNIITCIVCCSTCLRIQLEVKSALNISTCALGIEHDYFLANGFIYNFNLPHGVFITRIQISFPLKGDFLIIWKCPYVLMNIIKV